MVERPCGLSPATTFHHVCSPAGTFGLIAGCWSFARLWANIGGSRLRANGAGEEAANDLSLEQQRLLRMAGPANDGKLEVRALNAELVALSSKP